MNKKVHLIEGSGVGITDNNELSVCVVQAANYLVGGDGTLDNHPCIDPHIRNFLIELNDADPFENFRDELKPYAVRIVGTNKGKELTKKREFILLDWILEYIIIPAFENWAKKEYHINGQLIAQHWTATLECLPTIEDAKTYKEMRKVLDNAHESIYDYGQDKYTYAYGDNSAAISAYYAVENLSQSFGGTALNYEGLTAQMIYAITEDISNSKLTVIKKKWKECLILLDRLIEAK